MRLDLTNLPTDTTLLHQLICDLAAGMEHRDSEIEKLRFIIRRLQRGQFGRRSERLDPDQLQFGLEELDGDIARAEAKQPERPAQSGRQEQPQRAAFPEHLPRDEANFTVRPWTTSSSAG
jgi:transposase